MQLSEFKPANISHRFRSGLAGFTGAYPLNDAVSRMISPVFIVGCGRSGNTLLRSMLVHGGEMAIPPESYVWPAVARGFARWRYSSWDTVAANVVNAFEGSDFEFSVTELEALKKEAAGIPENERSLASIFNLIYETHCDLNGFPKRRWGDKTPLNILDIRVIEGIFPAAQYIHIVRDPRAVALSIMKASRVAPRIRERSFAEAADRWNRSVRNARALAKRVGSDRYWELRYEDLVRSPEDELRRLCAFLKQHYSPGMLRFHEGAGELSDVAEQAHHARVLSPLDSTRTDSWKTELAASDLMVVERATTKYRAILHYP